MTDKSSNSPSSFDIGSSPKVFNGFYTTRYSETTDKVNQDTITTPYSNTSPFAKEPVHPVKNKKSLLSILLKKENISYIEKSINSKEEVFQKSP